MPDGCKRILSPSTESKNRKAWNKTRGKHMSVKRRQNLAEADKGSYYNKKEWLEEFLDGKDAFYNGSENGDIDNDEQQQLYEGFANNCYKIVSPILLQELINNFAVRNHRNGTILLIEDVSKGFGN